MKVIASPRRGQQGSTLFFALCTMMVVGAALLTYLQLASNQTQLVHRSQVWNSCIALVEAGIEDALAHCAVNSNNMVSSGWALSNTNRYYRTNALSTGWYSVTISSNRPFDIVSTGYYPMPGSAAYVSRTVKVTTMDVPSFKFAMLARSAIKFNGNGTAIDSFDSSDPLKSTFGLYDKLKAGDKGDVGCESGKGKTFDIGNGNIWGHVYTGAGGNVIFAVGSNGKVGSVPYQAVGPKGTVQPGWLRTDLNVHLTPVSAPFPSAAPPIPGVVDGRSYDYVFGNGPYQMTTLNKYAIVTGDAIIHVTGNIDSDLFVVRAGATVQLYCSAASAWFDKIQNDTQRANAFQYLGLPSNTFLGFKQDLMGAIYAPSASLTLVGGQQVYGSLIMDSFELKGGSDVHYDQALAAPPKTRGFIITSWTEL